MQSTPQIITSLYHLVHIWYDCDYQEKLTTSIKNLIEQISDKTWIILNFVDEQLYSREEVEQIQEIKLAKTLSTFIMHYHFQWTNLWHIFAEKGISFLKWENEEVIKYLHQLLDWKWQVLKYWTPLERNWLNTNSNILVNEQPANVKEELRIYDTFYKRLLSEEFKDILLKLVNHFYWRNIYWIKTSENIDNVTVNNQERGITLKSVE